MKKKKKKNAIRLGLLQCCAPIGGAVETLWCLVWVRVIMFVSSFSSQQDSKRTERQLIIHYNYKTPINLDIDSAIDPDQHVRRREGLAGAHNHTEAAYSIYSFWFSTAVGVFFFLHVHPVYHSLL